MIEMKIAASSPEELSSIFAGLGRMVGRCVETTFAPDQETEPVAAAVEALVAPERAAEVEVAAKVVSTGEPEYEDVVAEKPKRTRKKKEPVETKSEVTPVDDPVVESSGLTRQDVQAALVRAREREGVGTDAVRKMLADMGGRLDDLPQSMWPAIIAAADKLGKEEADLG